MQMDFLIEASPLFKAHPRLHLDQQDATTFLRSLPDGCIDLIVTDPAYCSLEKHRAKGTTTRLKKQWFEVVPNSYYPDFLAECHRVLRQNTHFYIMCDEETSDILKPLGIAAGFTFWKRLIWDRGIKGMGYHYPASHEYVLFFEKGKRKLNTNLYRDVLEYPSPELVEVLLELGLITEPWPDSVIKVKSVGRMPGVYPTEKPEELCERLILESSDLDDVVLDLFAGSGSCGAAALKHGRRFAGVDIADEAMRRCGQRLGPWIDPKQVGAPPGRWLEV